MLNNKRKCVIHEINIYKNKPHTSSLSISHYSQAMRVLTCGKDNVRYEAVRFY